MKEEQAVMKAKHSLELTFDTVHMELIDRHEMQIYVCEQEYMIAVICSVCKTTRLSG